MKNIAQILLVVVALLGSSPTVNASDVTPVQKVIQLMQELIEKAKVEKHEEEVQWAKYKEFCVSTEANKKKLIAEAEQSIGQLAANIQKYKVNAARLAQEVANHEKETAGWEADIASANEIRAKEKEEFEKLDVDFSQSVDALERAIGVLKKQAYDRKQAGASLIEVQALTSLAMVPEDAKNALNAFLQSSAADSDDDLTVSGPETHGYEFQSQGIIDMLDKLRLKFIAQRENARTEESNMANNNNMVTQDLSASIAQGRQDIADKSAARARFLEKKASDEGEKADTEAVKKADEEFLQSMVATCSKKEGDFGQRKKIRAEEIVAVEKALEIIQSGDVSGAADKHLPALLQKSTTALAQLRANAQHINQAQVAQFLAVRGQALNSKLLTALAIKASGSPFTKVIRMIQDLITRLQDEADQEADHKQWCDGEIATNKVTREEKTAQVIKLTAEIDGHEATIQKLQQEIADLDKEIASLTADVAEAKDLRQKEKAKNDQTVADAKGAQDAVTQAMAVLRDFYEKAGMSTSFVQQQPEAPEIFDAPYQGMTGAKGGVMGLLEVIATDFQRLESETATAEAEAVAEFNTFMTESQVSLDAMKTNKKDKETKVAEHERALGHAKEDLVGTQKILNSALAYFDKLKPTCISAAVPFDQRVANRKEEIQSLEEALQILNGETIG